jgi:hypothetical protein
MTNEEKIKHHDTIAEIRQRIGGCFGTADGIFAGHPADEGRAKEIRKLAEGADISLAEVQDIVLGHLHRKGFTAEHIEEQFKNATDLFGKKLN